METRTVQQPPPCSSSSGSPAGATRQEARRVEGDSRRRGQEAALRDRAPLSQQRRLRQATQFLHKDSADLLPLDSLKRLGTSKDLQPHSVIQRRLVEGNQSRFQGESPPAQAPIHSQESRRKTSKTQIPALLVNCKCRDQELRVAVDTGTQHNQISAGCLSRLGLGKVLKAPGGDVAPGPPMQVEQLELQLGQETVACSAQVVASSVFKRFLQMLRVLNSVLDCRLCFLSRFLVCPQVKHKNQVPLPTTPEFQCCIDLEHGVLRLRAPFSELPFLPLYQEPGQ